MLCTIVLFSLLRVAVALPRTLLVLFATNTTHCKLLSCVSFFGLFVLPVRCSGLPYILLYVPLGQITICDRLFFLSHSTWLYRSTSVASVDANSHDNVPLSPDTESIFSQVRLSSTHLPRGVRRMSGVACAGTLSSGHPHPRICRNQR